ncbi:MAG: NAD(P)/FAD-dependent oxidoreductase, partial [Leptospiraceae bacterium]|nr:NAD(P)/FAD-dependent oxidoreductase [Leptospiraceae bacterium]
MQKTSQQTLVIIGNGVTGITAARFARKINPALKIQIISDESDYFWSRTALMYIYMGHMRLENTEPYERDFYRRNRLELVRARITAIDTDGKVLTTAAGERFPYDHLLIATGARPNRFGWPGQDLERVQGMYSLQDLHRLEEASAAGIKRAVIVGGGLIGIELAEMLHTRHIPVTMLVRENNYWDNVLPQAEAQLINTEIRAHGIELKLQTELKAIVDDGQGRAGAVITNHEARIDCQLVGLTAGVSPNIELLHDHKIETARGVLVNYNLETNISDVYAAGDCAQFRNPEGSPGPVEQLWYTGRMQGENVGVRIGRRSLAAMDRPHDHIPDNAYDRGVWFNSAKFFTIEYQTYGFVPPHPEHSAVWIHPDGKHLIRLTWDLDERQETHITGMNALGVRFRQDVFEHWIRSKQSIDYVVEHLGDAAFDPE